MDSPRDQGLHGHLSWVFDRRDDFVRAAVEFLDDGATLGQRLLYIGDRPVNDLLGELGALPARDLLLQSGGLAAMSLGDPTAPGTSMTPEERGRAYDAVVDAALAGGYAGLRVAIDTTAMAVDPVSRDEQARWERLGDRYITERPLAVLCGIDSSVLGGKAASHLACLHPTVHAPITLAPFCAYVEGDGIALAGEADGMSAELLGLALAATPPSGSTFTVDFSRLEFIDGRAFASLQRYAGALSARGGQLVITGARPVVRRLAALLGCRGVAFSSLDGGD
ncbi:MAG: MEDS domain-containing protein [Acidimicrobiales bacterium]